MADKKKQHKIYLSAFDDKTIQGAQSYLVNEIIQYAENTVASRLILKKTTGSITLMSFDKGQGLQESVSPFESFSHIIDGRAEMVINNVSYFLETGMCIVIPAHTNNSIKPNGRFKMILTTIKSGYE